MRAEVSPLLPVLMTAALACAAAPARAQAGPASAPAPAAPAAAAAPAGAKTSAKGAATFDHGALDAIVKRAVKGRLVDYDVVAKEQPALRAYLERVASADVSSLGREEKLAFYTNAYNATVLNAVLALGRGKSVLDVPGFFDKTTYRIAGEQTTLNALEETKIRSSGDPRVHFAVNCASWDCPPLSPRAFTGARWEKDLEKLTRDYLSREGEVAVDEASRTIRVVQLFEWYQRDWGDEASVRAFIARYVKKDLGEKVKDPSFRLAYRPYDWRPNAVGTK